MMANLLTSSAIYIYGLKRHKHGRPSTWYQLPLWTVGRNHAVAEATTLVPLLNQPRHQTPCVPDSMLCVRHTRPHTFQERIQLLAKEEVVKMMELKLLLPQVSIPLHRPTIPLPSSWSFHVKFTLRLPDGILRGYFCCHHMSKPSAFHTSQRLSAGPHGRGLTPARTC